MAQYGMGTAVARASAVEEIHKKAEAYNTAHSRVDGMDVTKVYKAAQEAIEYAREKGPYFLEAVTYRFEGHSMGDPERCLFISHGGGANGKSTTRSASTANSCWKVKWLMRKPWMPRRRKSSRSSRRRSSSLKKAPIPPGKTWLRWSTWKKMVMCYEHHNHA